MKDTSNYPFFTYPPSNFPNPSLSSNKFEIFRHFLTIPVHPTITSLDSVDSDVSKGQLSKDKAYQPSKVLLLKGIPDDAREIEVLMLCKPFGVIKDVLVTRHKRYAFIEFETVDQAIVCYQSLNKFPKSLRGYSVYIFFTGKDEINKPDTLLGPPSRFLLLIFGKEPFRIEHTLISQLVSPFGLPLRIELFETKTKQAFVEMEDVIQAIRVKESLDGKYILDATYLSVLYTEEKDFFMRKASDKNIHFGQAVKSPFQKNLETSMPNPMMQMRNQNPLNLYDKENYMASDMSENQTKEMKLAPSEQLNRKMNSLSPLLHAKEEKSTNILMIKNLPKNISARMLFRLFGMYGNVVKVKIFYKSPENALIEYQDNFQANLAKVYLNNCSVYGSNIFVTNSKQGVVINTNALRRDDENQYMGDYTNSIEHRYKFAGSKNHYNIAPPSKVIHLSNLCLDKGEDFYRELFDSFAMIKKFIFLKGKEKMALMEVGSVSEAVSILMNFHNYNINGKFLKVSFSKYSNIKESE